jgi:hypothetical protein
MDTYNVALFGLIGLVIALIVTGGLISMVFGEEPSMGQLAAGATVGAAAGGVLGGGQSLDSITNLLGSLQKSGEPEMKVGLPGF